MTTSCYEQLLRLKEENDRLWQLYIETDHRLAEYELARISRFNIPDSWICEDNE